MRKSKIFNIKAIFVTIILSACTLNQEDELSVDNQLVVDLENDSTEEDEKSIENLIKQLYKWEESNKINFNQIAIVDKNENKVIGLDIEKNKELVEDLNKTNFFSKEFLDNYQKIAETLDRKIKNNEMEWYTDFIPSFGNDANPWCNCQDTPYDNFWEKMELNFIEINEKTSKLTWTWGDSKWSENFNYEVRLIKENEEWKISYLEGFNHDVFTKTNQ